MAIQVQFDLFKTPEQAELDQLRESMKTVRESNEKVRRCLFARHNDLSKQYTEIHSRLEIIERGICRE